MLLSQREPVQRSGGEAEPGRLVGKAQEGLRDAGMNVMYLLSVHSVLLKESPSGPVLGGSGCLLVWLMSLHSRVLPFPADSHQVLPDPPMPTTGVEI